MNISQVKAKARAAVARREDEIEQEEIEGGEINLVPYLDIVTNLMLFLLASTSASFILGQLNTTLPQHAPANAASTTDPAKNPDEQPLSLIVSVTPKRMLLWSTTGLEGTLEKPKAQVGALPPEEGELGPDFNYQKINDALYEIAERRYKGKARSLETYEVILQVDGDVPYSVVIETMDNLRRRVPPDAPPGPLPKVVMPTTEKQGDKEVPTEAYDPDKHYLFPDILFAKPGFE